MRSYLSCHFCANINLLLLNFKTIEILYDGMIILFRRHCKIPVSKRCCVEESLISVIKNHVNIKRNKVLDLTAPRENRLFAYAKTKTQISLVVTAKLISAFVFATWILQSIFYLNPKFQASSHLLWPYSPVCVGPGRKVRRPVFSQRSSYIMLFSTYAINKCWQDSSVICLYLKRCVGSFPYL